MRKVLISIGLCLLAVAMAHGQGVPVNGEVLKSTSGQAASVRVCEKEAIGTPCTVLASIYKDELLTVPEANPLSTDAYGNYFYYAAPGTYKEQITSNRVTRTRMVNIASVDGVDIKPRSVAVGTTVQVKAGANLQSVIDSLSTTGGTIVMSPGTYTGNLVLPDNWFCVNLVGAGPGLSIIKATSGTVISKGNVTRPVGCVIKDLTIDGDMTASTLLNLKKGMQWKILEVQGRKVAPSAAAAFVLGEDGAGAGFYETTMRGIDIRFLAADGYTSDNRPLIGLNLKGTATDNRALTDITVVGAMTGIRDDSGANMGLSQAHIWSDVPFDYAVDTKGYSSISQLYADGPGTCGVHVRGNGAKIFGSDFLWADGTAAGPRAACLDDTVNYTFSFYGNTFHNYPGTDDPVQYGSLRYPNFFVAGNGPNPGGQFGYLGMGQLVIGDFSSSTSRFAIRTSNAALNALMLSGETTQTADLLSVKCKGSTVCHSLDKDGVGMYTGGLKINTTQVIDSSGNWIGGIGTGVRVLAQSAVASTNVGQTAAFDHATITVPANTLGLNGALRITTLWSYTNSSNNKELINSFGSTWYLDSFQSTTASSQQQVIVRNRNSAASQVGYASAPSSAFGSTTGALNTGTLDTTADQTFKISSKTTLETAIASTALTGNGAVCTATVASGAYATGDYIYTSGGSCPSGTPNVGSATYSGVQATNLSGTQYSYPCTCNGTASVQISGQRFSKIKLEAYTVEVIPGLN